MNRVRERARRKRPPTRAEILKGIVWKPLKAPAGVPADAVAAENRRVQDYIVGWAQGLAAHMDKYEQAQEAIRRSDPRPKSRVSVQAAIDTRDASDITAELRDAIDPADLAGNEIQAIPGISVRDGISGSDLDGLRRYLRSLCPFEIRFGRVSLLPPNLNSSKAAALKLDVISPILEEINAAVEQHANCKPPDSDYRPHAIVAYVKAKAVKKYVGRNLLAGRTITVRALRIRHKSGKEEEVLLIDAPAPWKPKAPQRTRAKLSQSRRTPPKRSNLL